MPMIYQTRDGDMPDALCADYYGPTGLSAALTRLLEANPGLADQGAVYPAGLRILLPDPQPMTTTRPLRLWD